MSGLSVTVLGTPALLLAGGAASVHCVAMCGALSAQQARATGALPIGRALALLHGGRLLGYAALGAVAGGTGQQLMRHLPDPALGRLLQLLAAALLVAIGVALLLRPAAGAACCRPSLQAPRRGAAVALLLRGIAWAALPCGLLYSVLLLAALSGRASDGALLAGAFALGGTPLLALVGWRSRALWPRRRSGWWLVAIGLLSLAATLLVPSDPLRSWCAAPAPVSTS